MEVYQRSGPGWRERKERKSRFGRRIRRECDGQAAGWSTNHARCYNDNTPERPQIGMMIRDWVVQGINRIVNEVE
jgi:hypothetical protein